MVFQPIQSIQWNRSNRMWRGVELLLNSKLHRTRLARLLKIDYIIWKVVFHIFFSSIFTSVRLTNWVFVAIAKARSLIEHSSGVYKMSKLKSVRWMAVQAIQILIDWQCTRQVCAHAARPSIRPCPKPKAQIGIQWASFFFFIQTLFLLLFNFQPIEFPFHANADLPSKSKHKLISPSLVRRNRNTQTNK